MTCRSVRNHSDSRTHLFCDIATSFSWLPGQTASLQNHLFPLMGSTNSAVSIHLTASLHHIRSGHLKVTNTQNLNHPYTKQGWGRYWTDNTSWCWCGLLEGILSCSSSIMHPGSSSKVASVMEVPCVVHSHHPALTGKM